MSGRSQQWAEESYGRVWDVLVRWFRVPKQPPTLPTRAGESVESFRPAEGFLKYLKLQFWIVLAIVDLAILIGWVVLVVLSPVAGILLAVPALVIAVVPDVVAYVAIHLRYDTTWYVLSQRSLRIRRGIWVIHEMTFTFENVQNVSVSQGPIQRWFGIADVRVDTAGGGGLQHGGSGGQSPTAHGGLIEGIADPQKVRDLILKRLGRSTSAGLGDEEDAPARAAAAWTPAHLTALAEVRDAVAALVHGPSSDGAVGNRS